MKKLFENFRKFVNEDKDIEGYIEKYSRPPEEKPMDLPKANPLDPNAKPTFNENDLYDGTSNFPFQLWNACAELGNKERGGSPEYNFTEIITVVMQFLESNSMAPKQLEVEYKKMEAYVRDMVSEESTSPYGRYDSEREQKVLKDIEGAREIFERVVSELG